MKKKSKLHLRRETVHALDSLEMHRAVGAAPSDGPTDCIMNDDTTGGGGGSGLSGGICNTVFLCGPGGVVVVVDSEGATCYCPVGG